MAQSYDEKPRAVPVAMLPEDESASPSPSQMLVDERAGAGWPSITRPIPVCIPTCASQAPKARS
ncbi:hypothetical protein RAA17_00845 [Komagataeibacter rhaeticus]|nr:hypothetical protein [Komagataeibacter rhaeticus]